MHTGIICTYILVFTFTVYHSKNMNKNLKFWNNVHNSQTYWKMSKSFRYLEAFSCNLEKIKKFAGNKVFLWLDDFIKKLSQESR